MSGKQWVRRVNSSLKVEAIAGPDPHLIIDRAGADRFRIELLEISGLITVLGEQGSKLAQVVVGDVPPGGSDNGRG
jgi:hypothetical protein